MITRVNLVWLSLILTFAASEAASEGLDVTMRMVEEHEDITDSVTRQIRLPELPALRQGGSRSRAEDAPGQQLREQARERGREFGQSVSERVREARPNPPEAPGQGRPPARPGGDRPERPPQSARP